MTYPADEDTLPMGLHERPGALRRQTSAMPISRPTANGGLLSVGLSSQLMILATMWDMAQLAVLVTDADAKLLAVNPEYERITGYAAHEVMGLVPDMFQPDKHPPGVHESLWAALTSQGNWQGEMLSRRKNGNLYPEHLKITALRDPHTGVVTHYVASFSDLSLQKAAQRRALHMASHDQLTNLPNQLLLRDRAEQAISQAKAGGTQVGLVVLDMDHFKTVNDSLGHAGGDEMLRQIGRALASAIASTETVSRRGGDEFVVLCPITEVDSLRRTAQHLLAALSEPFRVNGREAVVSASVGVALCPADGSDFDALLNNAEVAMYQAKDAGRRCVRFFTQDMNQGPHDRMALLGDLSRAAQRGEFRLFYQPLVNLNTSEIVGAEALIRWERPGVGLVPPNAFIPLAESTGLVVDIGQWVLHEACMQQRRWMDAGQGHLFVAVNVSALQFRQGLLEQQVADALQRSGCNPSRLELELTESTLMVQPEEVMAVIHRLKQRGVQLAIDDFGTGYSSLAYLRRLAVDKIKIDQSFVRDLTIDPDGAAIVRAVIQMARSLGLRTVGEGIETQVNRRALQVLGCDLGQGYFFGKPMPAADFDQLMRPADT